MAGRHSGIRVVCLVAVMAMFTGGCTDKAAPPVKVSDIDALQGTWIGTEVGNEGGQWTFVISGTAVDVKGPEPEAYSGSLKLDEEATPKQADFTIEKCEFEQYIGATSLAIYKIEEGVFTMAGNEPGATDRPTGFEAGGDTRVFTFTKQ